MSAMAVRSEPPPAERQVTEPFARVTDSLIKFNLIEDHSLRGGEPDRERFACNVRASPSSLFRVIATTRLQTYLFKSFL